MTLEEFFVLKADLLGLFWGSVARAFLRDWGTRKGWPHWSTMQSGSVSSCGPKGEKEFFGRNRWGRWSWSWGQEPPDSLAL